VSIRMWADSKNVSGLGFSIQSVRDVLRFPGVARPRGLGWKFPMGIGQVEGSEQVCRHWSSRTVWPQLLPAYVLRYISILRGPEFAHPMDMFFGLLTNDNI